MKIGRLLLRATVGGFFIGHGTQKLFGAFGGEGLNATAATFDSMGIKPGNVQATLAGVGETFGGAGLALGYRTPLASSAIVASMISAIQHVHLKNGPWAQKGGYEYNAVLAAAAIVLAESGPGPLSLDALRGKERIGAKWGLLALGLGAAGAAGSHLLAAAKAEPVEGPVEPVAAPPAPAPAADSGVAEEAPAEEPAPLDPTPEDEAPADAAVAEDA